MNNNTVIKAERAVSIPFGNFTSSILGFIGGAVVSIIMFLIGTALLDQSEFVAWAFWLLACFGAGILLCWPIALAFDLSDRIPEIAELKAKDPEKYKELNIRHPKIWIIVLLTLALGWSGIAWIIAWAMALSPGKVPIPTDVFDEAFGAPTMPQMPAMPADKSIADKIKELDSLVAGGVITQEEAAERRKVILAS